MAYNYETNVDSPNYTPQGDSLRIFGYNRTIEGITIHWWGEPNQNPQFDSIRNYLSRAAGNTSAHFVASGTGRRVSCIVAPQNVAWHTGSAYGNAKTIGIECDPRAREEDYDVIAELIADIRSAYGDVPLYWHYNWTPTKCPGVYDVDKLDKLSYTKFSHDTAWGKGGNKAVTPAPVTPPSQPAPQAPGATLLFKVIKNGKQIGAYAKDLNAWTAYRNNDATSIQVNGADVTASLKAKFTQESPTAGQPDSGKAVVDKDDYEETKARVNVIWAFLLSIFKNFGK